jgi:hypothetical protein
METITREQLDRAVEYLNAVSGGDYALSGAYGGYKLVSDGGSREVTQGHRPKRECLNLIRSYTEGYVAGAGLESVHGTSPI